MSKCIWDYLYVFVGTWSCEHTITLGTLVFLRPFNNKKSLPIKNFSFSFFDREIKVCSTVHTVGRSLGCWATLRGWWCSPPVDESRA